MKNLIFILQQTNLKQIIVDSSLTGKGFQIETSVVPYENKDSYGGVPLAPPSNTYNNKRYSY